MEELRQEVVPIRLVVVGADVEFLGLGAALHLNLTPLTLLLGENGRVVQPPKLRFQLQTKQTLRSSDQRPRQRHLDVPGLDVFQDVVLLPLEPDVHLVFEVKQSLGVVLRAEVNLVADASADVQLNLLIEVKGGDPSLALGNLRVFGLRHVDSKGELGRTLRLDFNFIRPENRLKQLVLDGELGRKRSFCFVFLLLQFIPVFGQIAFHVKIQEFLKGEVGGGAEFNRVPDGLGKDVEPCVLVVGGSVLKVVRPIEVKTRWTLRRVEGILCAERKRQNHLGRIRVLRLGGNRQQPAHQQHRQHRKHPATYAPQNLHLQLLQRHFDQSFHGRRFG